MRLLPFALFFSLAGCNESALPPPANDGDAALDLSSIDRALPTPDLAGSGIPTLFFGKFFVGESCTPNAPKDPIDLFTDLFLNNDTAHSMGPFHIAGGSFLGDNGQILATFALDPIADFSIAAGGQEFIHVMKTPGSISPANGCMTLPCPSMVRYVIDWGLAGVAPTEHSASSLTHVSCTR